MRLCSLDVFWIPAMQEPKGLEAEALSCFECSGSHTGETPRHRSPQMYSSLALAEDHSTIILVYSHARFILYWAISIAPLAAMCQKCALSKVAFSCMLCDKCPECLYGCA